MSRKDDFNLIDLTENLEKSTEELIREVKTESSSGSSRSRELNTDMYGSDRSRELNTDMYGSNQERSLIPMREGKARIGQQTDIRIRKDVTKDRKIRSENLTESRVIGILVQREMRKCQRKEKGRKRHPEPKRN